MGRNKKYTAKKINSLAVKFLKWAQEKYENNEIFWFKDFALSQGFSAQRLSEFAESSKVFSEALKRVRDIQESALFKAGMSKNHNPGFVIFALKNVSGWRDTQYLKNEDTILIPIWDNIKDLDQIDRLRRGENPFNVLRPDQYRTENKK